MINDQMKNRYMIFTKFPFFPLKHYIRRENHNISHSDSLNTLSFCGPRIFGYYAFLTKKMRDSFFYFKKPFLENGLESPLIFVFFLKEKQNKKEKPLMRLMIRKGKSGKPSLGSGIRLLIGKVRWKCSTPLSP